MKLAKISAVGGIVALVLSPSLVSAEPRRSAITESSKRDDAMENLKKLDCEYLEVVTDPNGRSYFQGINCLPLRQEPGIAPSGRHYSYTPKKYKI